jgi:hypothetical protein
MSARSGRSCAPCGTVWRGRSARASYDSCSQTLDPPTARARRRVEGMDLPRSWRWSSAERRSPSCRITATPAAQRFVAGDSADSAAPRRQSLRRHRCGPSDVEPAWIERLIGPVLIDGFDYVSPYYVRHVNEGRSREHRVSHVQSAVRCAAAPARRQRIWLLRASRDLLPGRGVLGSRAGAGRDRPLAGRRRGVWVPRV